MSLLFGMIPFLIVGILFVFVSLGAFFFPYFYISEIILSFFPYLVAISLLGLVSGIVLLKRKLKYSMGWSFTKAILAFLVISCGLIFMIFSRKFTSFYNFPVSSMTGELSSGVKILYANIYKNNNDYTGIKMVIDKEKPDLIFFVEFAQHHYDALKEVLKKEYPYTNSTIWSKKFVGNVVFSKIKIENWADDFPQDAWRYGYFSVSDNGKPLYFYLVHMSSPSSDKNYLMRNNQILNFLNDFNLHRNLHRTRGDKVVLVGDFNTTPWSPWYWRFADVFEGEFVNVTRSFPILFTRRLIGAPLFWAHIDHIFANKEVSIAELSRLDIPGSDHKGFSFLVQ